MHRPSHRLSQTNSFPPSSCSCCRPSTTSSTAQLRTLAFLRDRCATFVLTNRAWAASHHNPTSDISPSVLEDLVTDPPLSSSPSRALDGQPLPKPVATDIFGSRSSPPSSFPSSPLPSTSAFSSAPTAVVPLVASRVSLPSQLRIIPMLSVLPPEVAIRYTESASPALLRSSTVVLTMDFLKPLPRPRVAGLEVLVSDSAIQPPPNATMTVSSSARQQQCSHGKRTPQQEERCGTNCDGLRQVCLHSIGCPQHQPTSHVIPDHSAVVGDACTQACSLAEFNCISTCDSTCATDPNPGQCLADCTMDCQQQLSTIFASQSLNHQAWVRSPSLLSVFIFTEACNANCSNGARELRSPHSQPPSQPVAQS